MYKNLVDQQPSSMMLATAAALLTVGGIILRRPARTVHTLHTFTPLKTIRTLNTPLNREIHIQAQQKTQKIHKPTKTPSTTVVLVHGLLGYGVSSLTTKLGVPYFRDGITSALHAVGVRRIITPDLPPVGSIEARAAALAAAVADAGPVIVMAHSMGGLDARWWVTHLGGHAQCQALVTIGTPHRGSSVASILTGEHVPPTHILNSASQLGGEQDIAALQLTNSEAARAAARNSFLSRTADVLSPAMFHPDSAIGGVWSKLLLDRMAAFANLTPGFAADFNQQTPNVSHMPYIWFCGVRRPEQITPLLRWTSEYCQEREGQNDGLVSVTSADWGTPLSTSPVLCADHWELIGTHAYWRTDPTVSAAVASAYQQAYKQACAEIITGSR